MPPLFFYNLYALHPQASAESSSISFLSINSTGKCSTQQVNLNGSLSSIANCPCGVPQGSVLSPALFNIHINDLENSIPDNLDIDTTKYADDCTEDQLVEQGKSSSMQIAIDYVCKWAETNKMELNPKKLKICRYVSLILFKNHL